MISIGLMSGTSLDGVDVALIDSDGVEVQHIGPSMTVPYPDDLRERLRAILGGIGDVAPVERDMTQFHAEATRNFMTTHTVAPSTVEIIGFHGHTIAHQPDQRRTWQIGDGAFLAQDLKIPVINDFRTADVAAGGQGAPLVPIYHAALAHNLVREMDGPVAVVNIGGVANVTWIGGDGSLLAFDTGPGNALIDDWAKHHLGVGIDWNGELAAQGVPDSMVIERFCDDPYFTKPPPKSLDRDDFAAAVMGMVLGLPPADGAATLTALTARTIALSMQHFPQAPKRWLVTGGGRRNPVLMSLLQKDVGAAVEAVETVGWDGDGLEAQAFAFLAVRTLKGLPITFPETTGVPMPLTGGRLHLPL